MRWVAGLFAVAVVALGACGTTYVTVSSSDGGSLFAHLCAPCRDRTDCDPGGLCLTFVPGEPAFCGANCSSTPCPDGYGCSNVDDGQGNIVARQCAPTSGTCEGAPVERDGGAAPADAGLGG
jgi:hypothetical protein